MFGYQESAFTVERQVVISSKDGPQTIELRRKVVAPRSKEEEAMWERLIARVPPEQRQPDSAKRMARYIAIVGGGCDLLLLYQLHQADDLETDWNRIVSEPDLGIKDLLCFEYVVGHGTSYTKDGTTTMY